ncbi:MAG TPA: transposase [Candidatus Paceibacterota bacterium]|nr:transposase [Candidatus Paceibacterota bacterium]HPT18194.1 transposase [Candidatus Paceibacterota bacterium]
MNNRDYKTFMPGALVHVYNRGNNKEKIFHEESDYNAFLFRLGLSLGVDKEILKKDDISSVKNSRIRINGNAKSFKLHSFCLMPNHFHLLIEQCGDVPISRLISQTCTSYAKYLNLKYKKVGHVFQDKFKAVNIENNPQFMWTSAYIHMNPVKDGLVKHPGQYKWSSYKDFTENRNSSIVFKDFLESVFSKKDFEKETIANNTKHVKDGL